MYELDLYYAEQVSHLTLRNCDQSTLTNAVSLNILELVVPDSKPWASLGRQFTQLKAELARETGARETAATRAAESRDTAELRAAVTASEPRAAQPQPLLNRMQRRRRHSTKTSLRCLPSSRVHGTCWTGARLQAREVERTHTRRCPHPLVETYRPSEQELFPRRLVLERRSNLFVVDKTEPTFFEGQWKKVGAPTHF